VAGHQTLVPLWLVPVPDGLAWYFTGITESRLRQAE
jgi:hypothetical protein